jgi:hypothetical protein
MQASRWTRSPTEVASPPSRRIVGHSTNVCSGATGQAHDDDRPQAASRSHGEDVRRPLPSTLARHVIGPPPIGAPAGPHCYVRAANRCTAVAMDRHASSVAKMSAATSSRWSAFGSATVSPVTDR